MFDWHLMPWLAQEPYMLALELGVAVAIDLVWGEMPNALHPVVYMGRTIRLCRDGGLRMAQGKAAQLAWGTTMALVIPALFVGMAIGLLTLAHRLGLFFEFFLSVYLLTASFAIKALGDAALDVKAALMRRNLSQSRYALRSLCSRDASALGESDIASATIGSLAENLSDSIIAPLFFFVLFGVPGAIFYRVVNTMDAIIGYRDVYEYLGKVPARLDDLVNLIPARVTAVLLLMTSLFDPATFCRGLQILWRDRRKTPSPNGGWPMSTMAGLLRVEVNKIGVYALGDPLRPLSAQVIDDAWGRAKRATLIMLGGLLLGFLAWARGMV